MREEARWYIRDRASSNLLEHLCTLRGLTRDQLVPDYSTHLHDPYLLPDMSKAVSLVLEAQAKGWFVAIFGDYDADGTPAAALLSLLLEKIDIDHEVILPTRATGYGLRKEFIEEIAKKAKLLITVDTGVTAVAEIECAKQLGMHVIVLDHHLPGSSLPKADAIVDPHLPDSRYPFPHLCGCAIAYKLAVALCTKLEKVDENFCKWLLDLVAISTVADMMPLVGENRVLVHYGLVVLRQNRRPGIKALLEVAGIDPASLTATTLGYVIGPRLNASGRLSDNRPAYELLVAQKRDDANRYANVVEKANRERQLIVDRVLSEAEEYLFQQNEPTDKVMLLLGQNWPSGVVGLVAGRLSQKYYRPVIVGTKEGDEIRASARSVDAYPIVDGLQRHSKFLRAFGGHKQAAGMSLSPEEWDSFTAAIKNDAASALKDDDIGKIYYADAKLDSDDLALAVAAQLQQLQPFGLGNPKPLLVLPEAIVKEVKFIGGKGNHLKLKLESWGKSVDAIGFDLADRYKSSPSNHIHVMGYLENNRWRERDQLQIQVVDYKLAERKIETISWQNQKLNLSA